MVKEWVNHAGKDVLTAPEISWSLGETVLTIPSEFVILRAGESKTITVRHQVNDVLKYWTPDTPYLYTLLLNVMIRSKHMIVKPPVLAGVSSR